MNFIASRRLYHAVGPSKLVYLAVKIHDIDHVHHLIEETLTKANDRSVFDQMKKTNKLNKTNPHVTLCYKPDPNQLLVSGTWNHYTELFNMEELCEETASNRVDLNLYCDVKLTNVVFNRQFMAIRSQLHNPVVKTDGNYVPYEDNSVFDRLKNRHITVGITRTFRANDVNKILDFWFNGKKTVQDGHLGDDVYNYQIEDVIEKCRVYGQMSRFRP